MAQVRTLHNQAILGKGPAQCLLQDLSWCQALHAPPRRGWLKQATQACFIPGSQSLECQCSTCKGHRARLENAEKMLTCLTCTNLLQDLSGRRVRHCNAEKKLAEWAAEARERELEKIALKHQKEQERAAALEKRAQV